MKKTLYIIGMAVATMFTSCQKDNLGDNNSDGDRTVAFSAESIAPLTRVTGSSWNQGDEIGIMAMNMTDGEVIYDNVKYLAMEDGSTVSFNPESEVIRYPEDNGPGLSFFAYYPYQNGWSWNAEDMIFDLSAQDGTLEAQSKVDLLGSMVYSKKKGDDVVFEFDHVLSKVQITVSNYAGVSVFENLDNLTATLYTKRMQYDLGNNKSVEGDKQVPLEMVKTTDGDKAIFTVIIAPWFDDVIDEIIFTDGDICYRTKLNLKEVYSGVQYNFTTTVGNKDVEVVELKLDGDGITDWNPLPGSSLSKDIEIDGNDCRIYTAAGMKMFVDMVNGGKSSLNGYLMNNIDLKGSEENPLTPMGDGSNYYCGTFDGLGHEISGIYIKGLYNQSLFGGTKGATIKNLGVDGSITGRNYVAGIVGEDFGRTTIINCYNKATILTEAGYGFTCGGIVGGLESESKVVNCYNLGTVQALDVTKTSYNFGGIAGRMSMSTVTACYSSANVVSKTVNGGVVGYNDEGNVISSYFDNTIFDGEGIANNIYGDGEAVGYSTEYMKSSDFLNMLNDAAYDYNQTNPEIAASDWVEGANGYPVLTFSAND